MGKADPSQLFSWSSLLSVWALLFVLAAVAIVLYVAARPKLFWPMLIIGGIIGCGPRIGGYFFLDEIISGAAVLGAMLRIFALRTRIRSPYARKSMHNHLFALWVGYMIMESIFGVIYNDDFRIIRWILFYAMIGMIAWVSRKREADFPFPSFRGLSLIIVFTTLGLYAAYLGQGMYFESLLGQHGRFLSQDMVWAGSAYAVFPTLIAGPASFFIINDRVGRVRMLAWASIAMLMAVAFYYDSRISWLVIFGSFLVGIRRLKPRNTMLFLFLFSVAFMLYMPDPVKNIVEFGQDMSSALQALWAPSESDVNRNLQLQVGFLRILDNPRTFFIGDGVYSHRFTAIPHIGELYSQYLQNQNSLIAGSRDDTRGLEIFRTVGFTALLIDTGVIGMFLFGMNWVFSSLTVAKGGGSNKMFLLSVIGMSFMWLLSNNITDITLLYLLIMPQGLVERWSRGDVVPKASET